jgi:hypothetical protein
MNSRIIHGGKRNRPLLGALLIAALALAVAGVAPLPAAQANIVNPHVATPAEVTPHLASPPPSAASPATQEPPEDSSAPPAPTDAEPTVNSPAEDGEAQAGNPLLDAGPVGDRPKPEKPKEWPLKPPTKPQERPPIYPTRPIQQLLGPVLCPMFRLRFGQAQRIYDALRKEGYNYEEIQWDFPVFFEEYINSLYSQAYWCVTTRYDR